MANVVFAFRIAVIGLMGWTILVVSRSIWRFGIAGDKLFIGFVALIIASSIGPYGPAGWRRVRHPFGIQAAAHQSRWNIGRTPAGVLFVLLMVYILFMVQQIVLDIYRLSSVPPWVLAPIHWREAARMNLVFNFWGLLGTFWIISLWFGPTAGAGRWKLKNALALPLVLGRFLMGWSARYIVMFPRGWRLDLFKFGLAPPLLMWVGGALALVIVGAITAIAFIVLIALPASLLNLINKSRTNVHLWGKRRTRRFGLVQGLSHRLRTQKQPMSLPSDNNTAARLVPDDKPRSDC